MKESNWNKENSIDADTLNYHELKDSWLWESKRIKILHVKEKDWLENKQNCIDKCLEFLSIDLKDKVV